MKTVIVTGAGGFIGGALTELLLDKGVTVYGVDISEKVLARHINHKSFIPIIADFTKYDHLHEILHTDADVFYHFALQGGFGAAALKDYALQIENAKHACDAVSCAIRLQVRKFVLASTVNTVELQSFIGNEDFVPRYTCIYAAGKLAAELIGKTLAHNGGLSYCTALIAMPYGERNHARTLPNIVMEQLLTGQRPKLIEGNGLYDLVYIDDVARGLTAIGEDGKNFRNYYVGHRRLATFKEWIGRIRDILAPETELGFGEYPDAPALDYGKIDLDALYHDTGFECSCDFRESILKTAEWIKAQS